MNKKRSGTIKGIAMGLTSSILLTLVGMLALAGVLMLADVGDKVIVIVNQIVKLASVMLGTCVAVPRDGERGLISGVVIALLYACIGYGMYVCLGGMAFDAGSMLGEMLICCAVGAVTGAIRANLPAKKKRGRVSA